MRMILSEDESEKIFKEGNQSSNRISVEKIPPIINIRPLELDITFFTSMYSRSPSSMPFFKTPALQDSTDKNLERNFPNTLDRTNVSNSNDIQQENQSHGTAIPQGLHVVMRMRKN